MLTFENVLEIFQEYLLRDPEEEILPCKRGYVRLTWDKDSRGRYPLPNPGGTV